MGVKKGKLAQKLFYLSFTGNFTTQCKIRGISIKPLTKLLIGNPKTQIKNPSKNEFLWFV